MNHSSKTLLLFIHGFMGDEASFSDFPLHLLQTLKSQFHLQQLEGRILPKFESKGNVNRAIHQLVNWLMLNATQPEFSGVILLCHSMGGILAVNAISKLETVSNVPLIALLSYDSPFYGIQSHTISKDVVSKAANTVSEYTNPIVQSIWSISSQATTAVVSMSSNVVYTSSSYVSNAMTSVSSRLFPSSQSSLSHKNEDSTNEFQTKTCESSHEDCNEINTDDAQDDLQEEEVDDIQSSLVVQDNSIQAPSQEPSQEPSLLNVPPQDTWKPWITAGVTATALAAGMYYTGGLAVSGSVARKLALGVATSYGYTYLDEARKHLHFLYPIWGEKASDIHGKMSRVTSLVYFKCFYIELDLGESDTKTFIKLPSHKEVITSHFIPVKTECQDVVSAHISLFNKTQNPGMYWILIQDTCQEIIKAMKCI